MIKRKSFPKQITDKQRINWLEEKGWGGALISDDNGKWAIVFDGFQNLVYGKKASDIQTTFLIQKKQWKNSVREAIDHFMQNKK
jgi:hypothetical protein